MSYPGNLSDFINRAMAYTWDQSHGYEIGGMGYPDFDCSGFVGRCLHEAGFNYPASHIGTRNMDDNPMSQINSLGAAGFTLIHVTDLNNIPQLQHGDIFVLNSYYSDWSDRYGHTFIYCENIAAYTDPSAYSDAVGVVARAKVEASSSRGNSNPGDSRRDGTGAYWEVWSHAYSTLVDSVYDPQSTSYHNFVTIARWGADPLKDILFLKRIRDGQYHLDNWGNKFYRGRI